MNTQLDQYTGLSQQQRAAIDDAMPKEMRQGFRGVYLDMARHLKGRQDKAGPNAGEDVDQLDFEFVLFASAVIDYDYIMGLIADYSRQRPDRQKMSREDLIGLIRSEAKFLDDREEIAAYIDTLKVGEGLGETAIRDGFERFKAEKSARALADIADRHGLDVAALQAFVDGILRRMIFDGEALSDLLAPLDLGWKARTRKELALMEDLIPLLHRRAQGREISGLGVYEQ